MKEKLVLYASSQLPGGDPDPDVKSVLSNIKPTNDLCESILGLNDYLTPNMKQLTRSTMVTVKKNKTMKWLQILPEAEQDNLTLFAMPMAYKEEQSKLENKRQELMIPAKR